MVNNNENDFQRMSETNYTWPAQVDATHQKTLETVIEEFLAII